MENDEVHSGVRSRAGIDLDLDHDVMGARDINLAADAVAAC